MKNHWLIWTDEDNAKLKALYEANTPMPKIMKELGRTKHAVYRQAAVIGARRHAEFVRRIEQMKAEANAKPKPKPKPKAKPKPKPEPAPEPKKKSFWDWLLGE